MKGTSRLPVPLYVGAGLERLRDSKEVHVAGARWGKGGAIDAGTGSRRPDRGLRKDAFTLEEVGALFLTGHPR